MSWFNIVFSFVIDNWTTIAASVAMWVLLFDRLAKLTPTESDNKIVEFLYKVFAILGVKVSDNTGK